MRRLFFAQLAVLLLTLFLGSNSALAAAIAPTPSSGVSDVQLEFTPSPNAPTSGTSYSLPTRESPAAASAAPSTAGGSVIKNNCKTSVTDGAGQGTYCFLAPINVPGLDLTKAGISEEGVSDYLRTLFTLFISFGGVVLFFSLVWAGLQYIWGGVGGRIEGVNEARARIRNAGIGTAIALGSFLILRTINPNIVAFKFTIPKIEVRGGATGQARAKDAIRQAKDAVTGGGTTAPRLENTNLTSKTGFRNDSWNAYALAQVQRTGLSNIPITDAAAFFPDGKVTDEGWVELLGKIAKRESDFNPNDVYLNNYGLLQLTDVDKEARARNYSNEDLKDPYKNIEVGVEIMARQLKKEGVIAGKDAKGKWIGGTAYWETLRRPL
ncbi:MAG: transglycosylase SLT domain-containing protein [Patescibacteria group bacterium]